MTKLALLTKSKQRQPGRYAAKARLHAILSKLEDLLCLAMAIFLLAIPGHFLWNSVAPTYFAWLPSAYHHIPLFDFFSLLAVLFLIRDVIFGKVPPSPEE